MINKIDLPGADVEKVKNELEEIIGLPGEEAILTSAKEGIGIEEVLEAVVKRIPPPQGNAGAPLQALIFDSHYDPYRGAIAYVRIMAGQVRQRERIKIMFSGKIFEVTEWYFPSGHDGGRCLSAGK